MYVIWAKALNAPWLYSPDFGSRKQAMEYARKCRLQMAYYEIRSVEKLSFVFRWPIMK